VLDSRTARDWLRIGEAAAILGVSEQTLRNWDSSGRLRPRRHPINGYRLYRAQELHALVRNSGVLIDGVDSVDSIDERSSDGAAGGEELAPAHWTAAVALDPKHRPQAWDLPSSTVRRDWRKFPQEAHVIRADGRAYRRFSVEEIAALQGLPRAIAEVPGYTIRQRIAAIGDAVPPPLAAAVAYAIREAGLTHHHAIEICSGVGGMALGVENAGFRHLAAVERDPIAAGLMTAIGTMPAKRVHVQDARAFDFDSVRLDTGLLCGGPPCQPWSQSGQRRGARDERDLMGWVPELVGRLAPEAFMFENVPGLLSAGNADYLRQLVERLRRPQGPRYGVAIALLNAADFGVPQTRRRIFIVGLRERSNACVHEVFDHAASSRTHHGPADHGVGPAPWRTVGDAIRELPDPGGWRRWPA
jgi:site-specific DNA-cytosine methylase